MKAAGATFLRGGAFKPRSSPYSFQGMGLEGLKLLKEVGEETGLLIISEVMEISQIELMLPYVDVFQVGARNMQNFNLLRELGAVRTPVVLKRGIAATIEELLLSAEYILAGGNYKVILCERGIRTFETYTRNTRDYLRDSRGEEALAPADPGRSIPRHGTAGPGSRHGARLGCRRVRRPAHRSTSKSGQGVFRWSSVALSRSVHQADGGTGSDRFGGWPHHRRTKKVKHNARGAAFEKSAAPHLSAGTEDMPEGDTGIAHAHSSGS